MSDLADVLDNDEPQVSDVQPEGGHEDETPKPSTTKGGKGKEKDETATLRAELARMQKTVDELKESERYWAGMAQGGKGKREPELEPEDPDDRDDTPGDDTPDKLVDDFSAKGIEALVKRGVLTKKAARELFEKIARKVANEVVESKTRQVSSDSKLLNDFPDLRNRDSELYKLTKQHLDELAQYDPAAGKSFSSIYSAARAAKATLDAKKPAGRSRREESDYDYLDDDRDDRARAQQGDRRPRRGSDDDGENTLGPEASELIKGMGISEDEFRTFAPRRGGRR